MALGVERGALAGGVGLLAGAALLAGCTADADPQRTPEPQPTTTVSSASPTATERPEVEKPTRPEAMRRDDVAGAEAAAQYFLQLYPYVYATGDLAEWKQMSHPECGFCNGIAQKVADIHGEGGSASGGEMTIREISSKEQGALFRVDIVADEGPSIQTSSNGVVTNSPGGPSLLIFALAMNDGGGWVVRAVQVEEPGFNG
ncbi:DUF6318 family protein [Georgenia thermotolerans]|uniref:DUF6318 domain-containing protein n=1 Tax=Georgenia thermotolerans TaxID=527326 RepID=A0A7J5UQD2_9MICO|nr:DUF6318 family protein [Georgenia thermotolerans]KAE8764420.1 hypothetical protein GB883_09080 [Georgenia thermotolerans]